MRIFLDPGHGGKDSGAVGTLKNKSFFEKDIVLNVAKLARDYLLKTYEVTESDVALSRDRDVFVTLNERAQTANKGQADIFISIHCNSASTSTANGFESYRYPTEDAATKNLQTTVHTTTFETCRSFGITNDRGKKTANFQVLRETNMPAVLVELGFMSNEKELTILINAEFQQEVGKAIAVAAADVLNIPKKKVPEKPLYRVSVNTVQVGAYRDHANILKQVELALASDALTIDVTKVKD